ncbi:M48 family metallopeptidase [Bacillus massiliigorillae]|uniref:M48 family metallopeptidase n=1 Tax=Bacillus massiliigorillae TaxID=1243664 RepID=UPI00039FFBFE|nr:M48 family metallopeptidase [Bacillus massiliigorillae]
MRKYIKIALGLYIMLAALLYIYIFHLSDTSIPLQYKGTGADPATFMNEKQLLLSQEFSEVRNYLFFLETPFEWLFYFLIFALGISRKMEQSSYSLSSYSFLQKSCYFFYLSILSFAAFFPFNYLGYHLSKTYQISTQSFSLWMKDELISFWINFGTTFIIVFTFYYLIQRSPRKWWLYMWLLSVPFTLFIMFVKPVVIDPLYNDFYPLKDKVLESKILALAEQAHIPATKVFEVNMAEKTNAMNAYVTSIGSNSRIVLWDTTLNKLGDEEILFIMAHEMGHYVEKHVYIGIALYLLFGLVGLWLAAKIMTFIIRKWGRVLHIPNLQSLSSFPLFLCTLSLLVFLSSPISNLISRYEEERADMYAMEMVKDQDAAVRTFQELSKSSLSQLNPPWLVKVFRYTHPTMLERISTIEKYELNNSKKSQ